MKTIKSILIAATLISASVVSTLSAQQAQPAQKHEFKVAIGDSVMIKRECQQYCTGERPSVWVWDKVHTVRQLGTKRFADGVLLMNIYSWMCEDCLIPVNGHAKESAEQAEKEQAEDKAAWESGKQGQDQGGQSTEQGETKPDEGGQTSEGGQSTEQGGESGQTSEGGESGQTGEGGQTAEQGGQTAEQGDGELKDTQDTLTSKQNFKHNYDRFTIGIRGGAAGLLHQVQRGNWNCGFDALLDLQYAHYWANDARPVDLGIIVGVGIGYSRSGMQAAVDTAYTVNTVDGDIDYRLQADEVKEHDGQLQLEVPIMFSLIHDNGLFFNIGPKFMLPLYTPFDENITNPNISAYFPEEGVTVNNEVITGFLQDNQMTTNGTDNGNQFSINVMLTAEIGYEWILKSGNSLGLGAYANYCVYNSFANNSNNVSLMNVTAPTATDVAAVDVLSATKTYANKLGYFDAGIKLAYHFNFPKKQYKHYQRTSKLF